MCWVFVAALGGYSSLQCKGFSLGWLFWLQTMCSRARRAQYLWHTGGMWNLPRQEKTESSQTCALAVTGGFLTTLSPGKSASYSF